MEEEEYEKIEHSCSFCGKSQFNVDKLVIGPGVYICNDCIDLCSTVIKDSASTKIFNSNKENLTPAIILKELNKHVISQDRAKTILSVASYNHLLRINHPDSEKVSKSNVLMVGPTGSGKTLLCRQLSKIIGVPFAIADATSLTEAGYVGEDVDTIITTLIENANGDISEAQKGIIYIDEIDKIAKRQRTGWKDVSGEGVQQSLLKIIEGSEIRVSPTSGKNQNQSPAKVKFDTSNLLFIFGGSFQGLEDIISSRVNNKNMNIGMTANIEKTLSKVSDFENEDLFNFGLIKEFVGRISFNVGLDVLEEKDLEKVLVATENSIISQFKEIFIGQGVSLSFDKSAIKQIAQKAKLENSGARGLRTIINNILLEAMFEIPGSDNIEAVVISGDVVKEKAKPLYVYRSKSQQTSR